MREDAAENVVGGDEHGEATTSETGSGERRRSIVELQNMLKKVSQSPFHNRYKGGEWSAAATDVMDNVEPQPNGVNGSSARMNPFYAYYLENKEDVTEDKSKKTSESVDRDSIFVPPPDFQSSPLDLPSENKTKENGGMFSEPKNNLFKSQNDNNDQDLFHRSAPSHNATANGSGFHDVTLNAPNLFKGSPSQRQNLSKSFQSRSLDLFKDEEDDLFQAVKKEDLLQIARPTKVDPFDVPASMSVDPFASPLNKEDDLFQSPKSPVANPFYTATEKSDDLFQSPQPFYTAPTKETDLFQTDSTKKDKQDTPTKEKDLVGLSFKENLSTFSTSSTNSVEPFPSPIAKDLFQDVSSLDDPFGSTLSKKYDPFQEVSSGPPDIFRRLPSQRKASKDIASNSSYSSLNSPSKLKLDVPDAASPDLFKKSKAPPPVPPKPFHKPKEITLTTPQGTKHDILQPTPIIQAGDLSDSPGQSPSTMNLMQSFKRPPKPLPRIRHRRPERPPQPEKPPKPEMATQLESPSEPQPSVPKVSPKPSFKNLKPITPRKQKTPEMKPVEPENYVVFEDILLTGQEKCVEDWPDDSPQLDPNFKPSGTLRLRRESLKAKADSDGGSSEDGSYSKKKDKKLRMSLLSRRGSKSKFPDDINEGKSNTLPLTSKSSKEQFSELHMSAGKLEDKEEMDDKKKPVKPKVNHLFRRPSTNSSVLEEKDMNGLSPHASKGATLDQSSGEDWEGGETHSEKTKKSVKVKFVPRRGFVIAPVETNYDSKGAHGYTPHKGSKEKSHDESFGAHGYTPDKKTSCCAEDLENEELDGMEDCKPKKSKPKPPRPVPRKPKTANGQSEPIGFSYHTSQQASSNVFAEDDTTDRDFTSPGEMYGEDEQDEVDFYKPKKTPKLKVLKKLKHKSKASHAESEDPPGATSSDYLSEAARAEWRAAQIDEQGLADNEDEDEDGDTDSLMEWWNTVEQWDEVPSDDEEMVIKDESKSFTILADKVHRGLRVFNKAFTERAEVLWQDIIKLHAIADDINEFHQKAKIAGITGGTTTAVGGVTAIAGLALAPFTFGASLVITAVGVGVATAGGIASASAAISDNVNNMQDQKKVEIVLQEYETHLLDIDKILHFVNEGLYKLRGHPFLRSGTQHYSEDWEIRRSVQMISLVDSPVMRATEITDGAVAAVQGLFKGMDKYFTKDSRELKKSCKKEMVARLKEVATVLNDTIVELNAIREELQEATGSI